MYYFSMNYYLWNESSNILKRGKRTIIESMMRNYVDFEKKMQISTNTLLKINVKVVNDGEIIFIGPKAYTSKF